MRADVVFAVRLLRRQPGLYAVTIGGLTLAIGLATAVFTIVSAVAAPRHGISQPASVYRLSIATNANRALPWNAADVLRLAEQTTAARLVATGYSATVGAPQSGEPLNPEELPVSWVTPVTG